MATPETQRKLNLLNLALNSYRHGIPIHMLWKMMRTLLFRNHVRYNLSLNDTLFLLNIVKYEFGIVHDATRTEKFWLPSPDLE